MKNVEYWLSQMAILGGPRALILAVQRDALDAYDQTVASVIGEARPEVSDDDQREMLREVCSRITSKRPKAEESEHGKAGHQ